jgi:hypothetical protein
MLTAAACSPDRDMPSPGTGPSTSRISQSSRGRLKATPDRRDVGSVSQLRSVEATYGILNAGDEAVRILNVVCTWGCTVAVLGSRTIPPSGSTVLTVTLDPIGKSGPLRERIDLVTNAKSGPVVTVYIEAQVRHSTSELTGAAFQATIFGPRCAGCHGASAAGDLTGAGLYAAVCAMCHATPSTLRERAPVPLREWIALGRPERGMPAYARSGGGPLTDKQIDSLVVHIGR